MFTFTSTLVCWVLPCDLCHSRVATEKNYGWSRPFPKHQWLYSEKVVVTTRILQSCLAQINIEQTGSGRSNMSAKISSSLCQMLGTLEVLLPESMHNVITVQPLDHLTPKQIQKRCLHWFHLQDLGSLGLRLVCTRFSSRKLPWAPNNCQPFILHRNIQPLIEASRGRLHSLHTQQASSCDQPWSQICWEHLCSPGVLRFGAGA